MYIKILKDLDNVKVGAKFKITLKFECITYLIHRDIRRRQRIYLKVVKYNPLSTTQTD
jgi:hypothetical protein